MNRAHKPMPGRLTALVALLALALAAVLPPSGVGVDAPAFRPAQWHAVAAPHLVGPGKAHNHKPPAGVALAVLPGGPDGAPGGEGARIPREGRTGPGGRRPWRAHGCRAPPTPFSLLAV